MRAQVDAAMVREEPRGLPVLGQQAHHDSVLRHRHPRRQPGHRRGAAPRPVLSRLPVVQEPRIPRGVGSKPRLRRSGQPLGALLVPGHHPGGRLCGDDAAAEPAAVVQARRGLGQGGRVRVGRAHRAVGEHRGGRPVVRARGARAQQRDARRRALRGSGGAHHGGGPAAERRRVRGPAPRRQRRRTRGPAGGAVSRPRQRVAPPAGDDGRRRRWRRWR
mmetsp:Transcript_24820/g.86427  ORF Transcript_24820/g.86427 Transcript_24820/m.86427 type:complete len:218 (-) Transcript_24820:3420-4073(-)